MVAVLSVAGTTVLRARIFEEGMIPGPTLTQSYFVNENSAEAKLPVVSLVTAPGNFWDPEVGIYVQDYKPSWEIPVNIELFENDGSDRAAFNERAGVKVNGLYSWQLPQKMLGVYFKKQYGEGTLDYPLLRQRTRSSYKNFALRASGSDWSYTLFRDVLAQHSTLFNMDLDIMAYRPAVVYVNGAYMGIHNIREKVDDDYIEKSYGLAPGSFDLVENEDFAEAGNLEAYRYLETLLKADLSDNANYYAVANLVDIENFTDFVITEMATGNTSIDHNVMAWKPKGSGKWRWVLMDVDRGFFKPTENRISFYRSKDELLLNELFENEGYRSYFAGRLNAQLFTTFHPGRMNQLIDEHMKDIEAEIPSHISRWEGTTSTYGNAIPSEDYWRRQVGDLRSYVALRPEVLLDDLNAYGFGGIGNLLLATWPSDAGTISIDGLAVPGSFACGPFLENMPVKLETLSRPGFDFAGWIRPRKQELVSRNAAWKYLDNGTFPGAGWTGIEFDDGAWKSGYAEFGYGDGDEITTVEYGNDDNNKHITTYFRKTFSVSASDLDAQYFILELLKDDGALVYLNGNEMLRANMPHGVTNSQSLAFSTMNGDEESRFLVYPLGKELLHSGENILAVEIHQDKGSSSDLSFNLGLTALFSEGESIFSDNSSYRLNLMGDQFLIAAFEANGSCILPETIDAPVTLSQECSPYLAQGDVILTENAVLTIEPGVEIWMPDGASIFVNGVVNALGTRDSPVTMMLNPDFQDGRWGALVFRNTPGKSVLRWVNIEDASTGPDPVRDRGAISAFYADLELDHLTIEEVHSDPITARYSDIALTNSSLHSRITGDLINVKYGTARIENCRFRGNDQPDTDAIDYDEVHGGLIRNSLIQDFRGMNSDAIDIGEEATQVSIDSIVVYNITDKGVSVGQKSKVTIQNSVFINCNMGVAVKDSGRVRVDRTVFYNNVDAIAVFEKNPGQAGGNIRVTNSILSNSSHASYFSDDKSSIEISHSLSDNMLLPLQSHNLYGNPLFADPSFFNFQLLPGSPAFRSGSLNDVPVDMGNVVVPGNLEPSLMISQFFIDGDNMGTPEFIKLYNPSSGRLDISGYELTKGVTAVIPEGTFLGSRSSLYLTNDASAVIWEGLFYQVIQWDEGKLSNDGEALQLEDRHGIVLDYLVYDKNGLWPADGFVRDGVFNLIRPGLDNHFPESWEVKEVGQLVSSPQDEIPVGLELYPNPARDMLTVRVHASETTRLEIYNLNGHRLGEALLDQRGEASISLSGYPPGILIIRVGSQVKKVVLLKD